MKFPLYSYHHDVVDVPVSPSRVLSHFEAPPVFVRSIGVSGVDKTVLRDEWADTIAVMPACVERAGRGYMVHPMWRFAEEAQAQEPFNVREMSFNFGWENYPGERGNDW